MFGIGGLTEDTRVETANKSVLCHHNRNKRNERNERNEINEINEMKTHFFLRFKIVSYLT